MMAFDQQRSLGVPGLRVVSVSLDPGALAATTAIDLDTGIAADATDRVIVLPAAALEVRVISDGAFVLGGTVRARFKNQSALAAAGGALTHTLLIFEG